MYEPEPDYRKPTNEQYSPYYSPDALKQLITQYKSYPETFSQDLIGKMEQDADYYGASFARDMQAEDFSIMDTVTQLGTGFLSGFTTFHIGEEPKNEYERIANSIGHLAGFVGYVPRAPFALLGKTSRLKNAADFLRGKSAPMLVANKATEIVRGMASNATRAGVLGKSGAVKTASDILQKPLVKDVLHQSFHLGVGMGVSQWQGGVDEMMKGFIGGAQTGAAFGMIGNLVRLPGVEAPRLGATFFKSKDKMVPEMTGPQKADRMVRTLASSLFTGLPATMRGDTNPEQIYEYLLGAYFGVKMGPAEWRARDKHLSKMFGDEANAMKRPELTEGWDKLSNRERELVKEEAGNIWDKRGAIISTNLAHMMGYNTVIPEMSKEYIDKSAKMPTPKTEIEGEIVTKMSEGKEVTKEEWNSYSNKEKEFYSNAVEASNFEGFFTYNQLKGMKKIELDALAERFSVPNRKNLTKKQLASELMFIQDKRFPEIVRKVKLGEDAALNSQGDVNDATGLSKVGASITNFVKNEIVTHKSYDNLNMNKKNEAIYEISGKLDDMIYNAYVAEGKNSRAKYPQYNVKPEKILNELEAELGFRLTPEGRQRFTQMIKMRNNAIQEGYISPRIKGSMSPDGRREIEVDFLSYGNGKRPVNAKGDSKQMNRPMTDIEKIYEKYFPEGERPAYLQADEFIVPGERWYERHDFYRFKEALEQSKGEEGTSEFYRHFNEIMKHMEKDNRYYMGGAGDKEKAIFLEYHPLISKLTYPSTDKRQGTGAVETNRVELNKFFNEIRKHMGPEFDKLYTSLENAYINRFEFGEGYELSLNNFRFDHIIEGKNVLEFYNGKNLKELLPAARERYKKAFVSNYLYNMEINGYSPEVGNVGKILGEGFLSGAKAYNKRAQIPFTSGYSTDRDYIKETLEALEKGGEGKQDLTPDGNYRAIFINDAKGPSKGDLSKAIEYVESTDGTVITRNDALLAQVKEYGAPTPEKQGQSKSFIMGTANDRISGEPLGALMGKYQFVDAGQHLSKQMEKENIHFIIYNSSAKQKGHRKTADFTYKNSQIGGNWTQRDKKTGIRPLVYEIDPAHIRNVYSEKQDFHNISPQTLPAQMSSSLTPSTLDSKINREALEDMQDTLYNESVLAPEKTPIVDRFLSNPKDIEAKEEVLKNIDSLGIPDVLRILRTGGIEDVHDAIYGHIMKVDKTIQEQIKVEGEQSEADVESWWQNQREFNGSVDRMMKLSQEINESILSMGLHKWNQPYLENVMRNWIVHRLTRPKVMNSGAFRMRPYDFRMAEKFPNLKENEFYLDEGAKDMKIYTDIFPGRRGFVTLGELWEGRHYIRQTGTAEQKRHLKEVFEAVSTRVPMDSVSGARVMNFAGFTGRKGYGIMMHPRAMRALGGADLDGDKAWVFFGGRTADGRGQGFKQSWKEMYRANEGEYTKYVLTSSMGKKNEKKISKNAYQKLSEGVKKLYTPYTTDNKNEVMSEGWYKGKTPRELLAYTEKDLGGSSYAEALLGLNKSDKGVAYFSPFARQFMSEGASTGRQKLGNVVIMKKLIAGTHNSLDAFDKGAYYSVAEFNLGPNTYVVHFKQTATRSGIRKKQFRNLSRTGVALGSDPMDELALKNKETMFDLLYDSLINVETTGISKINADGSTSRLKGWEAKKAMYGIFGVKNKERVDNRPKKNNKGEYDAPASDSKLYSQMRKLKRGGLYELFRDANNAMYGKNNSTGRSWSIPEVMEKTSNLGSMRKAAINSVLPRLSKVMSRMDYADSLISRVKRDKVSKLYKDFYQEIKSGKYDYLLKPLGRSTFTVKANKFLEPTLKLELWIPKNQERLAGNNKEFNDLFLDLYGPKMRFRIPGSRSTYTLQEALSRIEARGNSREAMEWKLNIIRNEVKKQNEMLMQDMTDMISTRRIHDAVKRGNIDLKRLSTISEAASGVRAAAEVISADRRKTTVVDELTETPQHESPQVSRRMQEGTSSSQTQFEIDKKIVDYKNEQLKNENEREIFDELISGSLWRTDIEALKQQRTQDYLSGNLTWSKDRWYHNEMKGTAKTGMNRFGTSSSAVSDNQIKGFVKDYNDMFNKSVGNVPEKERNRVMDEMSKAEETRTVEGVETNELKDPFEGFRGLKEGKLDKEGKDILEEAEEHLLHYHGSIKSDLQGMLRWMFNKNLDSMTYEDWRNFNHTMRAMRSGDFHSKKDGIGIKKLYYYLFPEAVDRDLMTKEFGLMKELGLWYTKDGLQKTGLVSKPTHMSQKLLDTMHYAQDQTARKNDDEIKKWHQKILHLEQHEQGYALFDIAGRQMEKKVGQDLLNRKADNPSELAKNKANAIKYFNNLRDVEKKHNWKDLKEQMFKVEIIDANGKTSSKSMRGEEYVEYIKEQIAEQNAYMEVWGNGAKEYRDMFTKVDKNGVARRFGPGDGMQQFDLPKFYKYIENLRRQGKDIPMEIGVKNMDRAIKQFQYENATTPEHRANIARRPIKDYGTFKSDRYIPHILRDKKQSELITKKAMEKLFNIPNGEISEKDRAIEAQKILRKHHQATGEWEFEEFKDWHLYDTVQTHLKVISDKMQPEQLASYATAAQVGVQKTRSGHMEGWKIEPRAYDKYIRNMVGSFYRSAGQVKARMELAEWTKKKRKEYGDELTDSFERFFNIYINNAAGYPAVLPDVYAKDPNLNVRGTLYSWWADNKVKKKMSEIRDIFGIKKSDVPKNLREIDYKTLKDWANLEAKFQMSALLFHPKTGIGNLYGGTSLTISSAGFKNLKRANNIKWLKAHLNPGKDSLGNEWNGLPDAHKWVESKGIFPEMISYETGINPNAQKANVKLAIKEIMGKINKNPDLKDQSIRETLQKYGITEKFWDKMAFFMKGTERKLRADSFLAHVIQAWEGYGGTLPIDHPIIIEHAKRGVKATQFLYNAPHRPMFAQTALGKVMSRFQLWSWNSVRFRNDVIREAAKKGWREGTPEFERFKRTQQIDLFMLGMSSVFMYSIFESALPAPWNWYQDTAEWLFGDDKERDRAFFGSWPAAVAPLQMVTPPVLRMAPVSFKGLIEGDFSKLSDYTIWSMFPMGRVARDVFGPNSIVENPYYGVEKITGLPYMQFGKQLTDDKEGKPRPKGIMSW